MGVAVCVLPLAAVILAGARRPSGSLG